MNEEEKAIMDLAEIAFEAFHQGCSDDCTFRGNFNNLTEHAKQGWNDVALAVKNALEGEDKE